MTHPAPDTKTPPPTLLRHGRFMRVWAGQASGAVGDQLLPVALNLYLLREGEGITAVSLVLGGRAVALVLCLLLGGVLADRVRRIRLLLGADVFRAALLLFTALSLTWLPFALIPVVTALMGAAEALSRPSYRSLIPTLLPDALLERGNALAAAAQRGSAFLGALLGATAVTALGIRPTLLAAASVYALGALAVLRIPDPPRTRGGTSPLADAAGGIRAVRERPWVVAVMTAVCLQLFAGTATSLTLLPVVARRELGGDLAYGAVIAAFAAGALPAVVLAGRWRPAHPGAVSVLGLVGFAFVPWSLVAPLSLPGVILCFALGGFVVELYMVYWLSALQREIPEGMRGKVLALDQLSAFALLPVGYALVGPSVSLIGEQGTLVLGGAVCALSGLVCFFVPGVKKFGSGT
ncbi:MFS transporter [Streptomyces sp. NPDC045251]|uniref:MFS transporter n=1 Tax=unclassified Streptomyces TaxID=2593676 RepID=UPI0033C9E8D5